MTTRRLLSIACLTLTVSCRNDATAPEEAGPVSAAQSEITVSAATVVSNDSVRLTLTTRDAQGRPITHGGYTVVFRTSGGLSTGIVSPAVDRGNGTYTATFRGVIAGLATTIGGTIDGEPVTHPLPTIRVRPGPFSPASSSITVTPRTVVAGGKAMLGLIARDAAGNGHDSGGLRVRLTAGGGSAAGSVGPVTDHNNGHYSATFTAATVGTPLSVTATVNDAAVTSPPPTVTVARGLSTELSALSVSSDTLTVEGALRVTFEARDSAGVARTSGGDSVRFAVQHTANSGDGSLSAITDHDDGTYSATFTASRDGLVRIEATVNGRAKSNGLPSVTVRPIPVVPQQSSVSVSADTIEAGRTATFSVLLRDLNDKPVTGSAHRIRFTTSADGGSSGTFGPTVDAGQGKYTATFKAVKAGTAVTVGATLSDSTQIQMLDSLGNSHLPSITVIPGPAAPDSSLLFADPSVINVRDSSTVRLVTRDAYGNLVRRGGRTVTVSRAGGTGVSVGHLGPVSDRQDGTYTAQYFADSAGTADAIRATIDGRTVTSASPTITVGAACTPGPLSLSSSELTVNDTTVAQRSISTLTLPSGVTTTITLRVRDAFGCPVTQPHNVIFSLTGGSSTGLLGPTVSLADGRYTATLTGHTAGSASTVSATVDATPVPRTATVSVVPGDVSTRVSIVTPSASSVSPGASVVLTLRTRDAAGNNLLKGGRSVVFFVLGNNPNGLTTPAADNGDGTYTATYTSTKLGSESVVAIIEGTRVAQSAIITVESP
jgi:adhesin/invasin